MKTECTGPAREEVLVGIGRRVGWGIGSGSSSMGEGGLEMEPLLWDEREDWEEEEEDVWTAVDVWEDFVASSKSVKSGDNSVST